MRFLLALVAAWPQCCMHAVIAVSLEGVAEAVLSIVPRRVLKETCSDPEACGYMKKAPGTRGAAGWMEPDWALKAQRVCIHLAR